MEGETGHAGETVQTGDTDEYRIDELARLAGTTVRNVRSYQDRGLLPPPRRAGRVGWYSGSHLARLRLIGELLGRGYSLANIAELLAGWEKGQDLSELLGLETALIGPWSLESPPAMTRAELAERLGVGIDEAALHEATRFGLLEQVAGDGERFQVASTQLLDAASVLVEAGVPLLDVLALGNRVSVSSAEIADAYVEVVSRHLFGSFTSSMPAPDVRRLTEVVRRLRPLATAVVDAELGRAMERRIQAEMGTKLARPARKASGRPKGSAAAR
ncbi:MAG: MerR family transcriptional regulator [Acidimicrobiales bacterium]